MTALCSLLTARNFALVITEAPDRPKWTTLICFWVCNCPKERERFPLCNEIHWISPKTQISSKTIFFVVVFRPFALCWQEKIFKYIFYKYLTFFKQTMVHTFQNTHLFHKVSDILIRSLLKISMLCFVLIILIRSLLKISMLCFVLINSVLLRLLMCLGLVLEP